MKKPLLFSMLALSGFCLIGARRAETQMMITPPPDAIPPSVGAFHPAWPGGFVTGNPSSWPSPWPRYGYNPNRPVAGGMSGYTYWDPYRGWVTNSNRTQVLNSALSPGRAPSAGSSIQIYQYWNGTQWVQGQRWLGQDGLWHGTNTSTQPLPNGGSNSNTTIYMAKPEGQ